MTASGWLVWQQAGWSALPALSIYVVSLVLNAAWSGLFFGQRRMDLAMIDVVLLWLSIAAVIALFWPIRPLAALLLVPYLVWVTIASALNFKMIQLNPRAASCSFTAGSRKCHATGPMEGRLLLRRTRRPHDGS